MRHSHSLHSIYNAVYITTTITLPLCVAGATPITPISAIPYESK